MINLKRNVNGINDYEKKWLKFVLSLVLAATAQAETVFVTLEKDNALAVVDPIEGKLIKTVPVGQRPRGIVISPDNKFYILQPVTTMP